MKSLFIFTIILAGASFAQAQNYFQRYGNEPVEVINRTQGANADQALWLMGVDRGDLLLQVNKTGRGGQIGLPLDTKDLRIQVLYPDTAQRGVRSITQGNFNEGLELLRPTVYPLFQYIELPPGSMNIHELLERYVFALVNSDGNEEEAEVVIERLPLNSIPPAFTVHALTFVSKLVELGKRDEALRLLNRIPMDEENSVMLDMVMQFANDLRKTGNFDEALFMYDRVQLAEGTEQAVLATLWSAYCNVALERFQMGGLFVEKAGEFTPDQKPYSLAQLVKARIELDQLDFLAAMEQIAQGVVAADVGYNWTPELTYTVGYCYENLDSPDTAREVYNEVILFFPDSEWSDLAQEGLTRLPPPAPNEPGA